MIDFWNIYNKIILWWHISPPPAPPFSSTSSHHLPPTIFYISNIYLYIYVNPKAISVFRFYDINKGSARDIYRREESVRDSYRRIPYQRTKQPTKNHPPTQPTNHTKIDIKPYQQPHTSVPRNYIPPRRSRSIIIARTTIIHCERKISGDRDDRLENISKHFN